MVPPSADLPSGDDSLTPFLREYAPLTAIDFYPAADASGHYPGWPSIAHGFSAPAVEDVHAATLLKQVHSATIREIHSLADRAAVAGQEGDGLICSLEGHDIAVVTADCVPVLIAGRRHVAALHCGWRGIQRGLLEGALKRLEALGEEPPQLKLTTGPYIQPQSFEVGPEVIAAFWDRACGKDDGQRASWQQALAMAATKGRGDRWYLDMGLLIATIALSSGLTPGNIAISRECTMTARNSHDGYSWPSYRRSGKGCGRVLSRIRLTAAHQNHVR